MSCFLFLWVLFIWKACSLGPPGPFQALLLLALLRQDPASGLWTGLACLLPPTPLLQGLKALVFSPRTMPEWEVVTLSPSFLGSTRRLPCSLTEAAVYQPLPQAKALLPSSTARAGPPGIPGYTGELSDTEALSSPSLAPKRSHQQVLHIQVQGHNC